MNNPGTSTAKGESLALYLHIPFCRHRCAYCDFNTYTSLSDLKRPYTKALCKEIQQVSGTTKRPAHSVYLGGGTPSLMAIPDLLEILQSLNEHFILAEKVEVTMEANPETVDLRYLSALREMGVNRLSFGVQSADASELALLEREHSFETVVEAVDLARNAGFNNINLDLIYGLPDQTLESWQRTLESALLLNPDHLSLYCLTIEPGTPMHRWLNSGRIATPNPDIAADQYEFAVDSLKGRGLVHYEISNWSKPGKACQHNLSYWRNETYLGFGAGAHGHAAGYRYHVVKQPRVYIRRIESAHVYGFPLSSAVAGKVKLDRAQMMSDTVITQLRLLNEGLDLIDFAQRFGRPFTEVFPDTTEQLIQWGLLIREEDRLLLSERGRFLSNQVFVHYV